ncbi:MAG: shikimate dehydrogenase [Bacteroidales bacterium]|jgi:shikimate dehydrogenase|nr:shikimate dehydrogenase [Bacteroidales bacterium]MDI9593250.1 shikimate dehydrogenase [Bacteroidota bacterium]HOF80690.1 shikimate dehydrogenase [Bacteroidales bacterium]HOR76034.1 shikimate dehydrogenase [Bacteroidales bacterium]HPL11442.1 shikimate dehydrogenase [Bacteroidales bacterium]
MKRFGIIGKKLSHSFSEDYFNKKFEKEGFGDCSYEMFELNEPNEISKLVETNNDLIGVNVTIPFKTNIIPFLDALDPVAKQVGAVNTITVNRIGDRVKLVGYNTDIYGFELSTNAFETYKNAVILGTGGAAKAVSHVLKKKNINHLFVSRKPTSENEIGYKDIDENVLRRFLWIINATPLGMFPDIDSFPPIPYHHLTSRHFLYDLIYNPSDTLFLKKGFEAGAKTKNGLDMLHLQAEITWVIWKKMI